MRTPTGATAHAHTCTRVHTLREANIWRLALLPAQTAHTSRYKGLDSSGGAMDSACSNKSLARSSFLPPYLQA